MLVAFAGILPLPLYAAGALSFLARGWRFLDAFAVATLVPLASLLGFWVFFSRALDTRFLYCALPPLACLLAEGSTRLFEFARLSRPSRILACGFLVAALLWNPIRHPTSAMRTIAVTPRDFLELHEAPDRDVDVALHLEGSRVVRLHPSWLASYRGGLFDFTAPGTPDRAH
jgi:hypothetical protein